MQTSIILSIKPKYAEKIFNGSKQFEFRRKIFRKHNVTRIIVYVTAPISKVIGEFQIEGVIELEPQRLWEQTKEKSGIEKSFFDSYFDGRKTGFAIKIGSTKVYEKPLELQLDFNVKRAPQFFVYV